MVKLWDLEFTQPEMKNTNLSKHAVDGRNRIYQLVTIGIYETL